MPILLHLHISSGKRHKGIASKLNCMANMAPICDLLSIPCTNEKYNLV